MKIPRSVRISAQLQPRRVVAVLLSATFLMSAPIAARAAVASHVSTAIKAAADAPATLTLTKGDNVREIAVAYSRAYKVSFKETLAVLLSTNSEAFFKGNPDSLIVGAVFVLPTPSHFGAQHVVGTTAVDSVVVAPTAESAALVSSTPVAVAQPVSATASVGAAETEKDSKTEVEKFVDEWQKSPDLPAVLAGLSAALGLIFLFLWRKARRKHHAKPTEAVVVPQEVTSVESVNVYVETNDAPHSEVAPQVVETDSALHVPDINSEVEMPESEQQVDENKVDENTTSGFDSQIYRFGSRFERVQYSLLKGSQLNNAAIDDADVTRVSLSKIVQKLDRPQKSLRFADIEVPEEHLFVHDDSTANPSFIQEPTKVVSMSAPNGDGLDLDVDGFIQRFARPVTRPVSVKFQVDFEALTDRTRLQAWMNQQTPEDVLEAAISAHDQNYDNVAHIMLSDVLFRGDAEQCSLVLKLRKAWQEMAEG